jgi:protein-S-isoprenylcysteine O-methyltransferase Ste14
MIIITTSSRSWRFLTRVVPVVVFGVLTLAAVIHIGHGDPSGVAVVGRSAYCVLLILQVGAFATQPPPRARDGRAPVWAVTLVATFGMVVAPSLPPIRHLWTVGAIQTQVQAVLGVVGMAIALPAMASLRRSFSLTPQARRLTTSGPYRIIRHPLYLGEALNVIGIMVGVGTLTVLVAALVVVAGEATRAALEERLLRQAFPDYEEAFRGVAHLVPGVW